MADGKCDNHCRQAACSQTSSDATSRGQSFRIDRGPAKHIVFGHGAHVCLGQHLAKMEMRILFEELPRIRSVQLDGAPSMPQAFFVNGPKTLPIRFERA